VAAGRVGRFHHRGVQELAGSRERAGRAVGSGPAFLPPDHRPTLDVTKFIYQATGAAIPGRHLVVVALIPLRDQDAGGRFPELARKVPSTFVTLLTSSTIEPRGIPVHFASRSAVAG
jgi:hypothetical protein